MRRVRGQQEQRALVDRDVPDLRITRRCSVDRLEQHRPAVLVEELRRRVDVEVGARVGPADDHHRVAGRRRGGGVVDAVVVDGGLQEVRVGLEPGRLDVV